MKSNITMVLLGDSITQGIGSRKINYVNSLVEHLKEYDVRSKVVNLALTGTTIEFSLNKIDEIKHIRPDYVIIMYGSVDLQIRPNMETNKWGILTFTPKRYKNIKGMLNPRPFMSHNPFRYLFDCIDNVYFPVF